MQREERAVGRSPRCGHLLPAAAGRPVRAAIGGEHVHGRLGRRFPRMEHARDGQRMLRYVL